MSKLNSKLIFTVLLPFMCGYFLTAFFNQINAVVAPHITNDITISSGSLGLMTAIYLLAFAFFQLPLGILLDKYGPRKVQFSLFMIASLGIFIFAMSHTLFGLIIGRAIIGIGMSAGLMAGFKAIRLFFSDDRIPLMNSIVMAVGTLGALCSTAPTAYILNFVGWREFLIFFMFLTMLIALLILQFVPDTKSKTKQYGLKDSIFQLKAIYSSVYFQRIAPLSISCFAVNMAFVGLWAGLWFIHVASFNTQESANHLFVMTIGLIIGIVINGYIADVMAVKFKQSITKLIGFGLSLFILVELVIVYSGNPGSYFLWFLFALLGRTVTLSYAAIAQYFPSEFSGKATTALNVLFFLFAFAVQYAFGVILQFLNIASFTHAFQITFTFFIILQIFSLIWFFSYQGNVSKVTIKQSEISI